MALRKYNENLTDFHLEMDLYSYLKKMYKTGQKQAYFFICESNIHKNKNAEKSWIQTSYRTSEIDVAFANIVKSDGVDIYGSTNLHNSRKRENENVIQIPAIILDLDYYNTDKYKDFTAQELVEELENVYFKTGKIPYPNGIVMSGGGIYLVWWFKFTPGLEGTILKRRVVTKILYEMLKDYGSDAKTLDAAHVFRLPNTYNGKRKEKPEVRAFFNELADYTLADMARSLPNLWDVWKKKNKIKPSEDKPRKNGVVYAPQFKERTLAFDHMRDIEKLIELRQGLCEGYREMMMFFLRDRYHTMHSKRFYERDETLYEESYLYVSEINRRFKKPLTDSELRTQTLNKEKLYRFKTETRNDWFDITLEEQIRLKVKTTEAKNEKSKRQMREKRKKDGAVSNEELREEIIRTIAEHPDMKDYKVAKLVKEKLGKCSKNTVQKVREEMEK
ncbi:TPA: replication protein [Bacillus cereus]|uniref:replication protein n=1 Tax=unclassified Bacillus cereus group TaxID=2750818 RepID=UPI001F56D172|nr:replication protein [Bacillus cereus]HDX9506494.1 replication protein [Bacillus thuringiensis]HDX9518504.1 replication protein [Bacillus thuringiensis]HEI9572302.1 replication protein [Bacillus cereus]HEI9572366.1 replication protein [Bacillus cereus]